MQTSTLRPGLLVVVRTSIRGNVSYITTDLGKVETVEGEVTKWETDRLVRNKDEQVRAVKVRALARSAIQTICAHSDFGLLCPTDKTEALDAAIAKATAMAREFNDTAELTSISFNVMVGKVEPNDARAIRAINQEMRELIEDMQNGMRNLDVEVIRKAANKAMSVGKMLEPGAQENIKRAIELARATARDIVKAGEAAAVEVDQTTIQRLQEARTGFLDLEEMGEVRAPAPVVHGVDMDLDTVERAFDKIEEATGRRPLLDL